jgi:poly(hydroxyalkanoate) depolymerase family esterase
LKNPGFLRALRALTRRANPRQPQAARVSLARPAANADTIQSTVQRALESAGIDAGVNADIGATIERALSAAGLTQRTSVNDADRVTATVLPTLRQPAVTKRFPAPAPAETAQPGEFLRRSYTTGAGTRAYKLYVPASRGVAADTRMPLVVMLHGCTQTADDFAAGTGMNALAERQGFLVAYPEQTAEANPSRCWNWFRSADQLRDSGEPSLIAGITRQIAAQWPVDERRIYVAGLSAGAAMAIVLAATYPELYAAVGVHSGLPYASAHDIPSAFAAMKSGTVPDAVPHRANPAQPGAEAVPIIVFHGDSDMTVSARNARAVVDQALQAHGGPLFSSSEAGTTAGRSYVRTVYGTDAASDPRVEHWTIRGGGHSWSGGSQAGSYTDPQGPDASAEMVRFFLSHARQAF